MQLRRKLGDRGQAMILPEYHFIVAQNENMVVIWKEFMGMGILVNLNYEIVFSNGLKVLQVSNSFKVSITLSSPFNFLS